MWGGGAAKSRATLKSRGLAGGEVSSMCKQQRWAPAPRFVLTLHCVIDAKEKKQKRDVVLGIFLFK